MSIVKTKFERIMILRGFLSQENKITILSSFSFIFLKESENNPSSKWIFSKPFSFSNTNYECSIDHKLQFSNTRHLQYSRLPKIAGNRSDNSRLFKSFSSEDSRDLLNYDHDVYGMHQRRHHAAKPRMPQPSYSKTGISRFT